MAPDSLGTAAHHRHWALVMPEVVCHSLAELAAWARTFGVEPWWAKPGARSCEICYWEELVEAIPTQAQD